MAVTFDGPNKRILITTVGTYTVGEDIYSRWKDWVQLSDNMKYLPAFGVTGGDPVGTANLDGYFFLRTDHGWGISAPEASGDVVLDGQLWPVVPGATYLYAPVGAFTVVFQTILSALAYKVVTGSGVTAQDKVDIVEAVWDEATGTHVDGGTFGGELATKADIKASASTSQDQAITGSVVVGTNGNGSYLNTQVLDGSNWKIDESLSGLTAEMVFNLPSADHKPGVFSLYARYGGNPPEFHYVDLWAYNYSSASWELLQEQFMPGGFTSMATYTHEYYERHIDRSNNDEVKIRLVHSVATYTVGHYLRIDYAEVDSIELITAADISAQVWADKEEVEANIKKVNDLAVDGAGTTGDPWGPA